MSYGYEQGQFATIPLAWDEAKGTLTVGPRRGSFPGMLAKRQLRVVFVAKDAPGAALGDSRAFRDGRLRRPGGRDPAQATLDERDRPPQDMCPRRSLSCAPKTGTTGALVRLHE